VRGRASPVGLARAGAAPRARVGGAGRRDVPVAPAEVWTGNPRVGRPGDLEQRRAGRLGGTFVAGRVSTRGGEAGAGRAAWRLVVDLIIVRLPGRAAEVGGSSGLERRSRTHVKFGIFFELSVPAAAGARRRGGASTGTRLEQSRLADEARVPRPRGAVEHHFLQEYSHCSAPEVFPDRPWPWSTSRNPGRSRAGVVCVPQINHPIRVAERAPAARHRVRGAGSTWGPARARRTFTELGGFHGPTPTARRCRGTSTCTCLPRLWTEERVRLRRHQRSRFPERPGGCPGTVQEPHPAAVGDGDLAGGPSATRPNRGIGCLGVAAGRASASRRRPHRGVTGGGSGSANPGPGGDGQRPGGHDELPVLPRGTTRFASRVRAGRCSRCSAC